jgi:hypothetical protein
VDWNFAAHNAASSLSCYSGIGPYHETSQSGRFQILGEFLLHEGGMELKAEEVSGLCRI